jgi:hypothetical protein
MISKPTTLILGAGSSMPYGFPSGYKLRKLLCDEQNLQRLHGSGIFTRREVEDFRYAFLNSSMESIDAFLANRGAHKLPNSHVSYSHIGKAAIAATLIKYEDPNNLSNLDNEDHWYSYLWQHLGRTKEDFEKSDLSIITFNYDRSLECYLLLALQHSFGISEAEAIESLKKIPIVHVYGKLGELDPSSKIGEFRPYTPVVTDSQIMAAADGLKVIAESRDDEAVFENVRSLLSKAERICFLGFGFDSTNVRRLNIADILRNKYSANQFCGPVVYSTCVGLVEAERLRVEELLVPYLNSVDSWPEYLQDNYNRLKKNIERNIAIHGSQKSRNYLRSVGVFERI